MVKSCRAAGTETLPQRFGAEMRGNLLIGVKIARNIETEAREIETPGGDLSGFFRHLRLHRDALLAEIEAVLSPRQDTERAHRVFHGFAARRNEIGYTLSTLKAGKVYRELMVFSHRIAAEFPVATSLLLDFVPAPAAAKKKSAV